MTWASALMQVQSRCRSLIPRLHNYGRSGTQRLALRLRANLTALAPIVRRKERGPLLELANRLKFVTRLLPIPILTGGN
jgi:hypothetical protein